jgi:hypothetical protein
MAAVNLHRLSGVSAVAARVSSRRRWFLRDVPRTYVLFVWLAFGLAASIYAIDWHPSGWSTLQQETAKPPQRRDVEYYNGSIVIVPARGDFCWQRMIDNRTGKMWDKGYVNCYEAISPLEKDQRVGMSSARMNAIGKAFNRSGDN